MSTTTANAQYFLGQKATLDALQRLSTAEELVIYCGAGVSLDRTNVTWLKLVQDIYKSSIIPGTKNEGIEALLASNLPPEQLASILIEAYAPAGSSENNFLGSKLKDILYTDNGWNPGLAMRNILRAAMVASGAGRKVTIITTNYDTYIEQAYTRHRKEMIKLKTPANKVPGMKRWVLSDDGNHEDLDIHKAGAQAETIELIYLHGRVDDSAAVEGKIVLSEKSYAKSRQRSSTLLREQFSGPSKAVLIVGASITDAPLIYALAKTRKDRNPKYALVTMPRDLDPAFNGDGDPATTESRTKAIGAALALRGTHLGVRILRPLDHFQTAQFLEELRVSLSAVRLTGEPKYYRASDTLRYAKRLDSWHTAWSARDLTNDPNETFRVLESGLQSIVSGLFETAGAIPGEILRLEVWARSEPDLKDNTVSLWATSVGPVMDDSARRHETIATRSKNASVRSLMGGKPVIMSIRDLGHDDQSSRWKTFFAVPIYAEVPVTIGTEQITANVPVGIITLASTWYCTDDELPSSVIRQLTVKQRTELKKALLGTGRRILRHNDS